MSKATRWHNENLDLPGITLCGKSTQGLFVIGEHPQHEGSTICGNCARVVARNTAQIEAPKPNIVASALEDRTQDGDVVASLPVPQRSAKVAAGKLTRRVARARVKALFSNRGAGLTFGEKVRVANACAAADMPRARMLVELDVQATKKRVAFPRRREHSINGVPFRHGMLRGAFPISTHRNMVAQ